MGESSRRFDRELFTLKMSELSREMQGKALAADRQAGAQSQGTRSVPLRVVDGQLAVLREWIEGVDRIGREVWQTQGETLTPDFVREIVLPEVLTLIAVRESTIKGALAMMVGRGAVQSSDLYPANHHLAMAINHLKGQVSERYEIETRTLGHKKTRVPAPVRPVNTGLTVTKAPAPSIEFGGRGHAPYHPKPAEVPHNPPTYFASDLWPQTNVILLNGQRRFSLQTQTLELCKYIISEMTPLFCEAMEAGKMKADAVQREHGGGMEDLLRLLLVLNDPGPLSGWGISDAAYRLGKEVRKSDEWLRLGEAILETQRKSTGKSCRVDAAERIGRNIDKLRKECGWSINKLAEKTLIDRKLTHSHVRGKHKPNPKTLKEYAQAFTKELSRQITANNLEE